jgi:hypothetical protein
MKSYLRNRPFMVITYTRRPKVGISTQVKNWSDNTEDTWDVTENMVIVDRISDKLMGEGEVIIDLLNNETVKNRLGSVSDATIIDGYVKRYYNDVKSAMAAWVANNSGNLEKIRQIAKDHNIELPNGTAEADTPSS